MKKREEIKNEVIQHTEEVKAKVKKLGPLKLTILIIMAVATILAYVLYDYIFGSSSVFNSPISESDFVNMLWYAIPRLIRAVQVITIGTVVATVIMAVINRIFSKNSRSITVARLANSIIRWITVIVLVIATLAVWGVDTTALITGAGVITLVVGLGMQSLIGDVVAGLFIVFENEFNVGDIVTIDGFRGVVTYIGIRTTKIELCGNVKIINNSEIVSVLNQSKKPSWVNVLVEVGYGEPLSSVEAVIKEKLQGASVENTVEPLNYDGVTSLGKTSITLQFSSYCLEENYYAAQRSMNRYIKNVFDENGVEIPYGQVAVRNAEEKKV